MKRQEDRLLERLRGQRAERKRHARRRIRLPIRQPPIDGQLTARTALLVAIVGRQCADVSEENALDCLAGYAIGLDMSIRGREDRSFRKSAGSSMSSSGRVARQFQPRAFSARAVSAITVPVLHLLTEKTACSACFRPKRT